MAGKEQRETLTLGDRGPGEDAGDGDSEDEEREVQELEQEVAEMGQRILDHRRTLPDRLVEALSTRLVAQRPILPPPLGAPASPPHPSAQTGATADPVAEVRDQPELAEEASLAEADQEIFEKLCIFRAKTASNIAAMPVILKRLNDCIARIDKVEGYNVNINPVFKRKRKR